MTTERALSTETKKPGLVDQTIRQYVDSIEFTTHARTRNSRDAYNCDLTQFRDFCYDQGIRFLEQLRPENLCEWIDELKDEGRTETTISRKEASLKGFLKWAKDQELLPEDLTEQLPKFKLPERLFQALNPEQIEALIESTRSQRTLKHAVLIQIALKTGARADEIVKRKVEDIIQSDNGQVGIKFDHKRKECYRIVPLDAEAGTIVKKYLSELEHLLEKKLRPDQPLFPGLRGRDCLSRQGFWLIIQNHGNKIGVSGLSPNVLRNTFVANFAGNLKELIIILGLEET
ncbi:hypothetical protein A2Z23_03495, partial [Candidatus Curtissbacteria bacterium RBG_16_39_7]